MIFFKKKDQVNLHLDKETATALWKFIESYNEHIASGAPMGPSKEDDPKINKIYKILSQILNLKSEIGFH